jgi:o-succinylbenzoate---CoA ligase
MNYPFDSIHFNGRDILITDILDGSALPASAFESASFSFVRKWFSDDDAFMQQTSGSTGTPKSITISRKAMMASATLTQQALRLTKGDTALLCLDPNFIGGKMMIVRAFVTGMRLIAIDPSLNPFEKIHQSNHSIDFTALVPAQLTAVLHSDFKYRLNEIKNIIVGGSPLNKKTIELIAEFRAHVFATYGMTETVSHIALQPVNGALTSEYFNVLPGINIDTDDRRCLVINAPFLDGPITTNDVVEIKSSNEFKWIGRWDNVINSGGVKIIPEKLEMQIQNIFTAMQISNRFIVSSMPDTVLGEKVVLLIEGDLPVRVEDLELSLQSALPRFHIPKQIFVDAAFATTENGKINRPETKKKIGN